MLLKKLFYILLFSFICKLCFSQNVGINTTGAAPASTNMFEVLNPSTTANSVAIYASHSGAITGTGYGIYIAKTGASTTNTAAYFSASGATNNYAMIIPNGGGYVGIGTTTPGALVHISGGTTTAPTLQISSDVTSNGAAINLRDEGSNHLWHTVMRGTDHATQSDQLLTIYSPDGVNFHQYIILKPDNNADSDPGEVIMPGKLGLGSNTTLNASAIIDMTSTTSGVLVPRMTKAQRDAITSPATALLVFVTDGTPVGFYYYTGSAWVPLVSTVTNNTSSPTSVIYQGQTLMVHNVNSSAIKWDNTAYGVTGATSTSDGAANTTTIVGLIGSGAQAAYYCDTLTAFGYTDWYLPSHDEMRFLVRNADMFADMLTTYTYWSSTEYDATSAYVYQPGIYSVAPNHRIASSLLLTGTKTNGRYCRCVRKP